MTELDDRFVKRGFWINQSQGSIMGQTLTVDSRAGSVVIALLTILASVATAQLWNLATFFYHQFRAKGHPSDAFYWQQQALLRTLPPPTALITDSVKLWWTWRGKSESPLLRASIPLSIASLFALLTVIGGIFSSYIVKTSNLEVLVNSASCAKINLTKVYENQGATDSISNANSAIRFYADDCYNNTRFLPSKCRNTYIRPNVSFTMDPAPCPWDSSMCSQEALPALVMDSGLLDLNKHFGFNLVHNDNVKFRKKATCNVLPLDGHYVTNNLTYWDERTDREILPGERASAWRYGTYNLKPEYHPEDTFIHSFTAGSLTQEYTMSYTMAYQNQGIEEFGLTLLPAMNHSNGDVTIMQIFLNAVFYAHPVDDPLFSAHKPSNVSVAPDIGQFYAPDNPGGAIGCLEQYQFCIAQQGKDDSCTELAGLPLQLTHEEFPAASDVQLAALELLRTTSTLKNIINVAHIQANDVVRGGYVSHLPNDQWKNEAISWVSTVWAGVQTMLTDYAVGPKERDPLADDYIDPPSNQSDKTLCKSVRMRKPGGFSNINVFGLSFIIAISVILTLFNMFVLRFFIFLSRFRRALAPRLDRWVQDGVFQLQRRAFEAYSDDERGWTDLEKEIPITLDRQLLAELPVGPSFTHTFSHSSHHSSQESSEKKG